MVPSSPRHLVTLGMFIIDEFEYLDDKGTPKGRTTHSQIGGGGTYTNIGARIWLPADKLGMIVDRGHDFPHRIQWKLEVYGEDMWLFRDNPTHGTTRALNSYIGDHRAFEYLTPRIRITPKDLESTKLSRPAILHFICSPSRAAAITSEVHAIEGWSPMTIYEPIPDRCVPEELPALIEVLPSISILSPNAEEAFSLLSMSHAVTKSSIEAAAFGFLQIGVGIGGQGCVIIRSGGLGAYVASRDRGGKWIDAYWDSESTDKVVDVTGAGNAFLGGLAAGLFFTGGDIYKATYYAAVSASYIIEQEGLPELSSMVGDNGQAVELWNEDSPRKRLERLEKNTR